MQDPDQEEDSMADVTLDRDGAGGALARRQVDTGAGYADAVADLGRSTPGTTGAPAIGLAFPAAGAPSVPAEAGRRSVHLRATGAAVDVAYAPDAAAVFTIPVGERLVLHTAAALFARGAAGAALAYITD